MALFFAALDAWARGRWDDLDPAPPLTPERLESFDMPPLTSDDMLTFAPRVDAVLLVVAEGRTERASLEKAKELLAEMNVVGVVLNRSAERDDEMAYLDAQIESLNVTYRPGTRSIAAIIKKKG